MKFDVVADSIDHISAEAIETSATSLIPKNAVLMVVRSGILARTVPLALTGCELAINQDLKALCPKAGVDSRFLYYLLQEKMPLLLSFVSRGATVHRLSTDLIRSIGLLLPPLSEQQRVIGILDRAFGGIATAKANAEKNRQDARTLFECHLTSEFAQHGRSWVTKPLESVSDIVNGYSFKSTDFSARQGVKCIKITNVGIREFVRESGGFLPRTFANEYSAVAVKQGSIVVALTRTIISGGLKVAVVPGEYDGALLNQRVASIQPDPKLLSTPFLFAYFWTSNVTKYVTERVNTLMQPNLSITDLKLMPIPVPPLDHQKRIADRLAYLHRETAHLESLHHEKLAALEALKQSLLHQAFSGAL